MKVWATRLAPALLVISAAACGSTPPSRFYVLTAVDGPPGAGVEPHELSVHLAAVELPDYLCGPLIVSRVNGNQLAQSELERWGEPLPEGVARTLAKNLAVLLPSERVTRFAWEQNGQVDRRVVVAIQRYEVEGGQALLEAAWSVSDPTERTPAIARRSEHVCPVQGDGYGAAVAAMSTALADFSGEIASAIRASAGERP
jgi:uncharacterized lipoprotein YmbA